LYSFEKAVAEADKAYTKDKSTAEIWKSVQMVSAARIKGNENYNKGEYLQAYEEYQAGLQYAKSNTTLLSNLAACLLKLEKWEECIDICTKTLRIKPGHRKALHRCAESHGKVTNCFFPYTSNSVVQ
jgi:tetratricopeptide (TPR) repeat protein